MIPPVSDYLSPLLNNPEAIFLTPSDIEGPRRGWSSRPTGSFPIPASGGLTE
jgi:hypothetical protein